MELIAILNQPQAKRRFFSREIRSSVKNTLPLFKFLVEQLEEELIYIDKLNDTECAFITKINGKKTIIEVKDTVRENFLEISALNHRNKYLTGFHQWSNKQIFGLKYSLWIVLAIIAIALVPVIISLAIQDNISEELQSALQISGIVLISTGGFIFIIYLIFSRISFGNYSKRFDNISEYLEKIVELISIYETETGSKKICWSCFKEIKTETPKCPHCGIDL